MSFEIEQAPEVSKWGLDWIGWLLDLRKRLATVIEVTVVDKDYKLAVGECVKIVIDDSENTPLNIAVEDGVYEIDISFEENTFGADQAISLDANNVTYLGEFRRVRGAFDDALATDEVDALESDNDAHFLSLSSRPRHAHCRLIISGLRSDMWIDLSGIESTSRRLETASSSWLGAVPHTSLGTLAAGENISAIVYVRRTG